MGSHGIETRLILDAFRRLVHSLRVSQGKAEKSGVSGAQLFVLQQLKTPCSIAELAQRTHTDPSSASTLVKRLQARGLVLRAQAKDDARRAEVRLSARGRAVAARATPVAQTQLFSAVESLPARQRQLLAKILPALADAMGLSVDAPFFFEVEGKHAR